MKISPSMNTSRCHDGLPEAAWQPEKQTPVDGRRRRAQLAHLILHCWSSYNILIDVRVSGCGFVFPSRCPSCCCLKQRRSSLYIYTSNTEYIWMFHRHTNGQKKPDHGIKYALYTSGTGFLFIYISSICLCNYQVL